MYSGVEAVLETEQADVVIEHLLVGLQQEEAGVEDPGLLHIAVVACCPALRGEGVELALDLSGAAEHVFVRQL